jgi:hypothetical protein
MRTVALNGKFSGYLALVDDEDYDRVAAMSWHGHRLGNQMYAYSRGPRPRQELHAMHRFVLGVTPSDPEVDHADRNGLNNQRSNLRLATHAENQINQPKHAGTSSRFKGVSPQNGRWRARIMIARTGRWLGIFDSETEAARAYDVAATAAFGRFAWLNFPDEQP